MVRFLLIACGLCAVAVSLTFLLRDHLFHSVPAHCLTGGWEAGSGSRRGYAFTLMQYEWRGRQYETLRTFGPLDDSPRKREWPEDIQRGHDWVAAHCRDGTAQVMYGLSDIAWFGDARGWHSVIANVVLRMLVVAAAIAGVWTVLERARGARSLCLTTRKPSGL